MATHFFWDPVEDNIVQERDDSGAITAEYATEPYLYGNLISQNRGGVESQYHFDSQGSTLALTDDNQQVTDTYAYSAFGEVTEHTGSTVNPFQYVGQKGYYRDLEIGEYEVRRRTLFDENGRWLSADPLRDSEIAKVGYIYASNSPGNRIDPSGMLDIFSKIFCLPLVLEPILGPIKPKTPACTEKGFGGGTCHFNGSLPQIDQRVNLPDLKGNCPTGFQRVTDTIIRYVTDANGVNKRVLYFEWCIQCYIDKFTDTCSKSCIPCVSEAPGVMLHPMKIEDDAGKKHRIIMEKGSKYHGCGCIV